MLYGKGTVVFLYTELAGYIRVCLESLASTGIEVHVFAYPVNPEAPFHFDTGDSLCHYYDRSGIPDDQLLSRVAALSPSIIVCSGWIDRGYLDVCRNMRARSRTVLALDNQPPVNLKSWLSLIRSRLFYKSLFHFAWVPGDLQVQYAGMLGFSEKEIFQGFYAIDSTKYKRIYEHRPALPFPKRFVYMGRYVDYKGIRELWQAFATARVPGWELWCAGHGPLFDKRMVHDGINHLGFVQPAEIDTFVGQGGVFILPSHKEPWGVVVHEFAAAGYPIICSESVGSASAFIREGINGFLVKPKNVKVLRAAMEKIAALSDEELASMAKESSAAAGSFTIKQWVETVYQMLETAKL